MQPEPPGFTLTQQQQSHNYMINSNFIDTSSITTHLNGLSITNSSDYLNNSDVDNSLLLTPVQYLPPPRTSFGTEGKSIRLHANHFIMNVPKGFLYQYNISITPEKCPKRINR